MPTAKTSRTTVGQPTVSLLCSPCHKAGKVTKLVEATAKFIDGVSHCTGCWSAYGDLLEEIEPGSRRYELRCQPCEGFGTLIGFDPDGMEHSHKCDKCDGTGRYTLR